MAVRKFHSVEEMQDTDWPSPDDPRLPRAIRYCWDLAARMAPVRFPPGVYEHRSIGELNAQTDLWEAEALTPSRSAAR